MTFYENVNLDNFEKMIKDIQYNIEISVLWATSELSGST